MIHFTSTAATLPSGDRVPATVARIKLRCPTAEQLQEFPLHATELAAYKKLGGIILHGRIDGAVMLLLGMALVDFPWIAQAQPKFDGLQAKVVWSQSEAISVGSLVGYSLEADNLPICKTCGNESPNRNGKDGDRQMWRCGSCGHQWRESAQRKTR